MKVKFFAAARTELDEAAGYYNAEKPGLGDEFAEEIQHAIQRIVEFPEAWAPISKRTRRCRTRRFPYGIIYQVRGEILLIVAVMHLHRSPRSWKSRVPRSEH